MDEEIPSKGEVTYRKLFPPIRYRMKFWESESPDIDYMGSTLVSVRWLPFWYESPPMPVSEEHLLYMKDRYGFENTDWYEDP